MAVGPELFNKVMIGSARGIGVDSDSRWELDTIADKLEAALDDYMMMAVRDYRFYDPVAVPGDSVTLDVPLNRLRYGFSWWTKSNIKWLLRTSVAERYIKAGWGECGADYDYPQSRSMQFRFEIDKEMPEAVEAIKNWRWPDSVREYPKTVLDLGGPVWTPARRTDGILEPRPCRLCDGSEKPTEKCTCQRRAVECLTPADRLTRLIAPCGWGKGFYIRYDIVRRAAMNPRMKFVIAIPRLAIGGSFSHREDFDAGEFPVLENNLCLDLDGRRSCSTGKIDRVLEWLRKSPSSNLSDRILLVSHVALALALKNTSYPVADTYFYIDEAHHLSCPEYTYDDSATQLGRQAERLLNAPCAGMTLTTATYFRGDDRAIVSEHGFKEFAVPLDTHMEYNLSQLRKITLRSAGVGYKDELTVPLLKSGRKTIIFIPRCNQWLSSGCPERDAERIGDKIRDMGLSVENFVGEDNPYRRRSLERFLGLGMSKKEHDEFLNGVDVVLAVNMLDEGFDWPQAEQVIDFAPPNSVGKQVQRVGRLLRDDKESCEYMSVYSRCDSTRYIMMMRDKVLDAMRRPLDQGRRMIATDSGSVSWYNRSA